MKAGEAAASSLLRVYDDPRVGVYDDKRMGGKRGKLWGLMLRACPRELGARIGELWDHPNRHIAEAATEARAAGGTADLASWARACLDASATDSRNRAGDRVLAGAAAAVRGGWAEPEFVRAILDWTKANLLGGPGVPLAAAVEFFTRSSPEEAREFLSSATVLSKTNTRSFSIVVEEAARSGAVLAREVLTPLLAEGVADSSSRCSRSFGGLLTLLSRIDPDEALRLADANVGDESKRRGIIEFRAKHFAIPHPSRACFPSRHDFTPNEVRTLEPMLIDEALSLIAGDGVLEYLVHNGGTEWRKHIEALEALKLAEHAAYFRKFGLMLGPEGPSDDPDEREEQIGSSSGATYRAIAGLRWKSDGEAVELAMQTYMISNLALFQRLQKFLEPVK